MEELPLEGLDRDGLGYEVVAIEGRDRVEMMLRLKAPDPPEEAASPFHVQIVLDTSETMHPRRLFPALRGIDYLASHLREEDSVGIVTFGNEAELALPGGPVGDGEEVRDVLRQTRPFGVPDPMGGLLMGLREAQRNARDGRGAIYLITTGALFKADGSVAHRLAGVAASAKEAGFPVTVFAMDGQGNGLLSGIGKAGGGRMIGTNDGSRVCEVILEKAPARRSGRIRGVEMLIDRWDGVRTVEVKTDEPVELCEDGILARVGDLKDGEARDVLVSFEVDDLEELEDDLLARLKISWSDLELEKALWAEMPIKVNGYPGDPRPRVRELFSTDPTEGVSFEFPESTIELRKWPGKGVAPEAEDSERPGPPKDAQERMRIIREKRKLVERMAEGDLPPEMEARIGELAREQASREVARLMDEIREQVPAQLLDELKAKVEEQFRESSEEDEEDEDGGREGIS